MVKKAIVTTCGSDCYCGEWGIEERRHGEGYYKSTNGEQYQGKWKNDKKDGYGKCSRPNGYYYEGFWKDDKPHGEGTLVLGEGTLTSPADKFVGTFEKGQKHGEGTYWNIWGRQSKQEWIHGQQQRHF